MSVADRVAVLISARRSRKERPLSFRPTPGCEAYLGTAAVA
jgi:hypothetical protein